MALRLNRILFIASNFAALISISFAALEITCPQLSCDNLEEDFPSDLCYQHDGGAPTKLIMGRLCYD